MKIKLNNLTELLQLIKQEEYEVEALENNLKKESKGRIRRLFFRDDDLNQKLKLYREEIKAKKDDIKSEKNYTNRLCSFNFEIATRFIAGVLSIIEGEKYETKKIYLKAGISQFSPYEKLMFPLIANEEDRFCIIATAETIQEALKSCDSGLISSKDDLKYTIKTKKYILIEIIGYELSLFDYNTREVPENFTETYPYLTNVIYDLINFRLANPSLSQSQLIEFLLGKIPERYSELIEKNKSKKR